MTDHRKKIQHLLLRAGFGARPDQIETLLPKTIDQIVDDLFSAASTITPLNTVDKPKTNHKGEVSNFRVLILVIQSKKDMEGLNVAWLKRMAETQAPLLEKMTYFWHNHFATSEPIGWLMQQQHNMLRQNALGSFRTMLHAVAKDPAMLLWLNNNENRKDAPNENFAREVMELFTLGEGNGYTENDIREAARTFTGWTSNRKGEYELKTDQHDDGEKTVFGKKGKFGGEDVLDALLANKQTAKYVTRKIYRDFVSETIDEARVQTLADEFFASNYDITKLMKSIFKSEWFYSDEIIGCRIASPVELIVRYMKLTGVQFTDEKKLVDLQRLLGQVLFFPPNVAGWKGGRAWIDSSSLLLRINMPRQLLRETKSDITVFDPAPAKPSTQKPVVTADWNRVTNAFSSLPKTDFTKAVIDRLIQSPTDRIDIKTIESLVDTSTDEKRIIGTVAVVMALPEFQLI